MSLHDLPTIKKLSGNLKQLRKQFDGEEALRRLAPETIRRYRSWIHRFLSHARYLRMPITEETFFHKFLQLKTYT